MARVPVRPKLFKLHIFPGATRAVCMGCPKLVSVPKEESANKSFILSVPEGAARWPDAISGEGRILLSETVVGRLIEEGIRGGVYLPICVLRVEGGSKKLKETVHPPTYYMAMAEGVVEIDAESLEHKRRTIPVNIFGEERSDVFNARYARDGVIRWTGFIGNSRFVESLRGLSAHNLEIVPLDFSIPDERRETFKINLKSKKWPPQWYPDWFTPHPSNLVEE